MSGGHFRYSDLEYIADEIESIIQENKYDFSKETLDEFMKGVIAIRLAKIYTQRIDLLISGDDREETFHKRLTEDMNHV
jgi:TnpA family transposase